MEGKWTAAAVWTEEGLAAAEGPAHLPSMPPSPEHTSS